jgi:hypothetical protein
MNTLWGAGALLGLALVVPGAPGEADDDLTVVKKAMKQEGPTGTRAEKAPEPVEKERPALRRGGKPQWLRVRVVEKQGRKKVNVNLPLALVRALGDDFDIGVFCGDNDRHGRRRSNREDGYCPPIKLAEVLAALDSGEDLVQVDDEDASVRVWVD